MMNLKKIVSYPNVMDILWLVYSQYGLKSLCEQTFPIHMAILKGIYYQPKKIGLTQTYIPIILDVNILDLQFYFFQDHNDV
jgi:hypothetical protein